MRFPEMGRTGSYRVTVPQLDGGVSYALPPHLVGDNQLTEVSNLWFREGLLQARPGLRITGGDYGSSYGGWHDHARRVGDQLLLYSYGETAGYAAFSAKLVGRDGELVDQSDASWLFYDRGTGLSVTSLLAIPVSAEAEGALSAFRVVLLAGLSDGTAALFGYGYDEEQQLYTLRELQPYAPTVMINGRPEASSGEATANGDPLEPYNLLTRSYCAAYTSVGEGGVYYGLPGELTADTVVTAEYTAADGQVYTHTTDHYDGSFLEETAAGTDLFRLIVSPVSGQAYFAVGDTTAPATLYQSETPNNVVFRVLRGTGTAVPRLGGMRLCTWFGGGSSGLSGGTRLFVSGNPRHPNLVHWSALNNPLYFPDCNYAYVGEDAKAVTAFGKQGELLVIFKDRELYCTRYTEGYTVSAEDLQSGTAIDPEAARAIFPLVQLHPELGCDCPDTIQLCSNRLVWLNSDGRVYGLFATGQYNERNVRALSGAVEPRLRQYAAADLQQAGSAELADQYLLMIGSTVYVMDYSSGGFVSYSSYASDEKAQRAVRWHRWELSGTGLFQYTGKPPRLSAAGGQPLLVGAAPDGATVLMGFREGMPDEYLYFDPDSHNEDILQADRPIPCGFTTKLFDFGYPERRKRVNRLYLQLSGGAGETLTLTYHSDRGALADVYLPAADGTPLSRTAPRRLSPNAVRVREFGLQVTGSGGLQVGSLVLHYGMMGAVR